MKIVGGPYTTIIENTSFKRENGEVVYHVEMTEEEAKFLAKITNKDPTQDPPELPSFKELMLAMRATDLLQEANKRIEYALTRLGLPQEPLPVSNTE